MQNIENHVLLELEDTYKASAHYITMKLKNKLPHLPLVRNDISQNLQKLKKRNLVENDGAVWWKTVPKK
jgi:hypothetical protein